MSAQKKVKTYKEQNCLVGKTEGVHLQTDTSIVGENQENWLITHWEDGETFSFQRMNQN